MARVILKKSICLVLAALVATFGFSFSPYALSDCAFAENLEQAKNTAKSSQEVLDNAQAQLDQISEEYDALKAEIDAMQVKIDELASKVLEAQKAMMDGRASLGNTAVYEYRNSSANTFVEIFFGASNVSELVRNMNYLQTILDSQAAEVASQKELRESFISLSDEITAQKDAQDSKLEELNKKREDALAVVEDAEKQASEDSERLDAMRKQADEFIWQQEKPSENDDAGTNNNGGSGTTENKEDLISPSAPVTPNPDENAPSSGGWLTGKASAYGGWSDTITGCPATTATGAVCDNNSMGVAVSVYMPNYRSYFGRTVEISYGGKTVYATVNDCGGLNYGRRALDLQPGVINELIGSNNCFVWGVRQVSYRFL